MTDRMNVLKKQIKRISKTLKQAGVIERHGHGLEYLAKYMGYESYYHLKTAINDSNLLDDTIARLSDMKHGLMDDLREAGNLPNFNR